ncbi:MAG TPA: PEGA domain-containing protein, partial [Kofleriaceae bacterium]
KIEIDPKPDGASGTVTDVDGNVYPFGPTSHAKPARLKVSANTKLHVHIELAGYQSIEGDYSVSNSETKVIEMNLVRARAGLHVTTTPDGAQVTLAHRVLGETPLVLDDLDAAVGADLVISKPGFEPVREKIDLVIGHPMEITETLKAIVRMGSIKFIIKGSWGDITFKGAPVGTRKSANVIKLPVGKQTLHIKNPVSKKQWDVTCTVEEEKVLTCSTEPPS